MVAYLQRLPFSLHLLVAEAKRRARRRRILLAVAVLTVAGGAGGAVAATHPFGWLASSKAVSPPDYRPAFPLRLRPYDDMIGWSPASLNGVAV